ncbi:Sodium- and chloride-dependent GABA transporter 1 [Portunus trituberculatus]|uniref:Sodium-and chloride-dependent GABA transporter 1 n=1 Tax=Portunus trituberculatus TaxID=210409 RepID=A0A5B7KC23_PORTR|nr:Sodium- and chloride-dependent GABA transporter 1 [Portunus trituberculatus]
MRNIKEEMGIYMPAPLYVYWTATWLFITPVALVLIFFLSCYYFVPAYFGKYVYPANIQALGWFICFSSVVFIPMGALYVLLKGGKEYKDLIRSSPDFCPGHVRKLREKEAAATKGQPDGVFRYTYDNEGFQEPTAKVRFRLMADNRKDRCGVIADCRIAGVM